MEGVFLTISECPGPQRGLQLSVDDEKGGYRLAGPKFIGNSRVLLQHKLDERDIRTLRRYLTKAMRRLRRTQQS